VSSYICAWLFLAPLLRALAGRHDIHHAFQPAVLGAAVGANDAREDYLRAVLTVGAEGMLVATPVNRQDSSLLGNLAAADGLVVRAAHAPAAPAGTPCSILRLPR
jgi:molybdopterin molybdotransferase